MRILIVSPKLSGGGAEYCAVMWANGFCEKGHDVIMLSDIYSKVTYQCVNGVSIGGLFPKNNRHFIGRWIFAFIKIRRSIHSFHPNVIIGVLPACSFCAKVASLGYNIPVVDTEHEAFERPEKASFSLKEIIFKFHINKIYECVTVISQRDKDVIGHRLSNVAVLPNPLSISPSIGRPHKEKTVLAVGRLDAWYVKGFDVLISAWREIVEYYPDWKLQIAGTGSGKSIKFLEDLITQNKLGQHIELLGFVSNMKELYEETDIFVLSSRFEGFGLVLIEAMSQGCACVACDFEGRQKEIMDSERNGLICMPDNKEMLIKKILLLISDSKLRDSIGNNAIARSKHFQLSEIISRWEILLQKYVR